MHILEKLRAANIARNAEWENPNKKFSLVFWTNELGGEIGEAANILKKLDREINYKAKGSRATIGALTEELGDIIICCDLIGMNENFHYPPVCWPVVPPMQSHNYSLYGAMLLAGAGRANAIVIHSGDSNAAYLGPLTLVMRGLVTDTKKIADRLGIDLGAIVATKFNMTSEKLGFKARLQP